MLKLIFFFITLVSFCHGMKNKGYSKKFTPCMGNLIEEVVTTLTNKNNVSSETYKIVLKENFTPKTKLLLATHNQTTFKFFCINKKDIKNIDFILFKSKVLEEIGLKSKTIQVIGDSNQFSEKGTHFGRSFLSKEFNGKKIIEYGYTGYKTSCKELDINSLVNEYFDKTKRNHGLANIVACTKKAITDWECYVSPHVKNFILVYNDKGMSNGHTTFGDDVEISDNFLTPPDDEVICLEGGIQSFLQATNSLLIGLEIKLVYNLRKKENTKYFSTAEFLHLIEKSFVDKKPPSKNKVLEIYKEYAETHTPWNPNRPDAHTKEALFEKAMLLFIEKEAFKKVKELCSFTHNSLD